MSKQTMRMPFSRNVMSMGPGTKEKGKAKSAFPAELDTQVNMKKVNLEVIKPWITKRVTELLGGVEDEVLIGMIISYLEDTGIKPKEMMTALMSFLEKNTSLFMKELWSMLISAQESPDGIPVQLIVAKQEEQQRQQAEIARIQQSLQAKAQSIEQRVRGARVSRFSDAELPPPPPVPAGGVKPAEESKPKEVEMKEPAKDDRAQTKRRASRSRSRSPPRRVERSRSRSPDRHSRRRRSPSPRGSPPRRRTRSRSPPRRRERTPERRDRDRSRRDRRDEPDRSERDDRHKHRDRDHDRKSHKATDARDSEEHAAVKAIGATEKKVDTLEEQVLGRIEGGDAGIKEVEAVYEFLAQATEALDGLDAQNSDRVRSYRKKVITRINAIMDRVEVMKDIALKKKQGGKEAKKTEKPSLEDGKKKEAEKDDRGRSKSPSRSKGKSSSRSRSPSSGRSASESASEKDEK
uniref:PWI domain-containing protein n=1 Tax=Pyramimonas obovata TaxID=1411642 RepID=A0A7S0WPQ6_9CHLO|mmetsp:Transcript_33814/g.73947  ORF Transcript_33814/g.73947 Transcript_33814/m.73947 type:complete len:463 (+) Transcript_33814:186-1574(+)